MQILSFGKTGHGTKRTIVVLLLVYGDKVGPFFLPSGRFEHVHNPTEFKFEVFSSPSPRPWISFKMDIYAQPTMQ